MDSEKKNLQKQQKEINKQYKEARKLYDTQLKELQQLQPQYEETLIKGYESQVPMLQQTATKSLEDIGMQKEATKQTRESALTTARRQYEQGLQRSQQLFGGVAPTVAGQASADIMGAEQLRQTGQATTQAAQNLMQLGGAEREVQANLANALQQVEVKKQQDLMRLRDTFRQEINAINAQKGALAQNKANAQLQALQDYNARRRQLEDYATQQRDAIANYERQLQLQLRYTPAQPSGAGVVLPDFKTLSPQQRATQIQSLLRPNNTNGQIALQNAGFDVIKVGNEQVIYNPYNGLTIGLSGRRYADFSPNYVTKEQSLEQVVGEQK